MNRLSLCGRLAYEVRKSATIRPEKSLSKPARSSGSLARQATGIISQIDRGETRLTFERGALRQDHPLLNRLALRWDNVKTGDRPALRIAATFSFTNGTIDFSPKRWPDYTPNMVFATPAEFRTFADTASALVMTNLSQALKVLRISIGLNVTVGARKNQPIMRVSALLMGAQIT